MTARFFRSDAMTERLGEMEDHTVSAEWFQLTYNGLRTAPDGEFVAGYNPASDAWDVDGDLYSDIVIANEEVPA